MAEVVGGIEERVAVAAKVVLMPLLLLLLLMLMLMLTMMLLVVHSLVLQQVAGVAAHAAASKHGARCAAVGLVHAAGAGGVHQHTSRNAAALGSTTSAIITIIAIIITIAITIAVIIIIITIIIIILVIIVIIIVIAMMINISPGRVQAGRCRSTQDSAVDAAAVATGFGCVATAVTPILAVGVVGALVVGNQTAGLGQLVRKLRLSRRQHHLSFRWCRGRELG